MMFCKYGLVSMVKGQFKLKSDAAVQLSSIRDTRTLLQNIEWIFCCFFFGRCSFCFMHSVI